MSKRHAVKPMFSLSPVEFRNSAIAGRGVFAKKRFGPGDVVVPYAPRHRRVDAGSAEAAEAADTKVTLLSQGTVIIPDTTVPGGWLCNHSCSPNADLYSSGDGRIQAAHPILPGEEVTIFYGWVSRNEPRRDPCLCGSPMCRGFINFDVSNGEASEANADTPAGTAFRERLAEYEDFLRSIGQEQVMEAIARVIAEARASVRPGAA